MTTVSKIEWTERTWNPTVGCTKVSPGCKHCYAEGMDAIRAQCEEHGVAFFFKQWGGWGADGVKRAKKYNGRELHGRTWDEMPMMEARL